MFKIKKRVVGVIGVVMLLSSATGFAGVRGSKHDLSSGGTAQETTTATTEVCVFCHTPHGSNTGVTAPLWNKFDNNQTYQRYSDLGTATLDGENLQPGSVSLACLSCHDGTQAMDVVINAPGSGLYDATGAQQIDPLAIGVMVNSGTDPIPMLGTDLRNDHPVSIAYAGGGCGAADCTPRTDAAVKDKDFNPAQHALLNGKNQWWVDVTNYDTTGDGTRDATGTANTREKSDMILYPRTFAAGEGPAVECGSCHDPHEDTARPVSFLRIANTNSDVCLACHIK